MSTKAPNYTKEQEARLVEVYKPKSSQDERTAQVAELATEMGRSTRSVIAKLTTMKVYVAKTYKTKKGEAPVRKEAIVTAIEAVVGRELNGLEKTTKPALVAIFRALTVKPESDTEEAS